MAIIALILVIITAFFAISAAINFFSRCGKKRAFVAAAFIVGIFLFFWASGLWMEESKYSWGYLTPIMALIIVCGYLFLQIGIRIYKKIGKENNRGSL